MASTRRPPSTRAAPSRSASGQRTGARPARGRGREGGGGSGPRPSDLLARVLVAVPAGLLAIAFIDLGGIAFALFMIVVGWLCMHELYRLLHRWRPVALVGFAALAALVLAAHYGHPADVLEVGVISLPVLFLAVLLRGHGGMTVAVAGTLLGIVWLGFAFAHAELLRELPHGGGVIFDVLIGTFLGDTGAYFGGRWFGRRPLAPEISPHKTVEGLFCGMFVTVVAVVVVSAFQTFITQADALLLGVTVAVLGPLGDLFESVVKRDAGTKDAGRVFGAHGGALDRLDAVIFTVVAGYYVWRAVGGG